MKIQLAFDAIPLEKALAIAAQVKDAVDVVEMGTPFLYANSLRVIREFREILPEGEIMADLKILDGGRGMAELAFSHGADLVSVSGRTWPDTIRSAIECARERGKRVLVDFEGTPMEQLESQARSVAELAPDYICVHRRFGAKNDVLDELRTIRSVAPDCQIALAGGIDAQVLEGLARRGALPDMLVCGKAIVRAASPRQAINELRSIAERGYESHEYD